MIFLMPLSASRLFSAVALCFRHLFSSFFPVDIHPAQAACLFFDQAEELPSIPLIKRGVIRDQIQSIDSFFQHISAHMIKEFSGDSLPPALFFHIERTDIRRQIFSTVAFSLIIQFIPLAPIMPDTASDVTGFHRNIS